MALDWKRLEKKIVDFKELRSNTTMDNAQKRQATIKLKNDIETEIAAMVAEVKKGSTISGDDITRFNEARSMFADELADLDVYAATTRLEQLVKEGDRVAALAFASAVEPVVMKGDMQARIAFNAAKRSIPQTDDESEAERDAKRAEVLQTRAGWLDQHIEATASGREEDADRLDKWLEQTTTEAEKAAEKVGVE